MVSFADLARRTGLARSTIGRAFKGPLRAALLSEGRADAEHPVVVAWARARGIEPSSLLGFVRARVPSPAAPPTVQRRPRVVSPEEVAELAGRDVDDVLDEMSPAGRLAGATLPGSEPRYLCLARLTDEMTRDAFGMTAAEFRELAAELGALTPGGRYIDISQLPEDDA